MRESRRKVGRRPADTLEFALGRGRGVTDDISINAFNLSESVWIPYVDTMCLRNFLDLTQKCIFWDLNLSCFLSWSWRSLVDLEWSVEQFGSSPTCHSHRPPCCKLPTTWMLIHEPLISNSCTFQAKGHCCVTIGTDLCYEQRFFLITLFHHYLIIAFKSILKAKDSKTHSRIY